MMSESFNRFSANSATDNTQIATTLYSPAHSVIIWTPLNITTWTVTAVMSVMQTDGKMISEKTVKHSSFNDFTTFITTRPQSADNHQTCCVSLSLCVPSLATVLTESSR